MDADQDEVAAKSLNLITAKVAKDAKKNIHTIVDGLTAQRSRSFGFAGNCVEIICSSLGSPQDSVSRECHGSLTTMCVVDTAIQEAV